MAASGSGGYNNAGGNHRGGEVARGLFESLLSAIGAISGDVGVVWKGE
jgi:hypothetical protein